MSETVRASYPVAVAAVRAFFERFYGDEIATSEDATAECVFFHVGPMGKTVAVSTDFLEFDEDEIPEKLAAWNVAHLSRTLEPRCRLNVTSEGPEEERL